MKIILWFMTGIFLIISHAIASPSVINSLSTGDYQVCVADQAGLKCWGSTMFAPAPPEGLRDITSVWSSTYTTCVIAEGKYKCWGSWGEQPSERFINSLRRPIRSYGVCAIDEEGLKCSEQTPDGNPLLKMSHPIAYAPGFDFSCALNSSEVQCWAPHYQRPPTQVQIPILKSPRALASGNYHACAIDVDGVKCWGKNDAHQLDIPIGIKNPRLLSAGGLSTCVVDDENVKCWGQLTNPTLTFDSVREISVGDRSACAVDKKGIQCWAQNAAGASIKIYTPPELQNPSGYFLGDQKTCAFDGGEIKCWGADWWNGPQFKSIVPPVVATASSGNSLCMIDAEGFKCNDMDSRFTGTVHNPKAIAGGWDLYVIDDQGLRTLFGRNPTQMPQVTGAVDVKSTREVACVLASDGVQCWMTYGSYHVGPVPAGTQGALSLGLAEAHACVVQANGHVLCWPLYPAASVDSSTYPSEEIYDASEVKLSKYTSCALRQNRSLITCWGENKIDIPTTGLTWFDIGKEHICLSDSQGFRCPSTQAPEKVDYGAAGEYRLPQVPRGILASAVRDPLFFNAQELQSFESELNALIVYSYAPKSDFLKNVITQMQDDVDFQNRLFLLFALSPFMKDFSASATQGFAKTYSRALTRYGELNGKYNLSDFAKSETVIRTSLYLIASALKSVKNLLPSSDDRAVVDNLIAMSGRALTEGATRGEFLQAYRAAAPTLDRARSSWEIKGLIETADKLVEFLR